MSQQRPAQQSSSSSRSKQQQHLDTLQGMINAILIETGKALRSANKKGAKTIAHDNDRLQMFMPSAISNFHSALDELESDIVRAKAVVARDLRELRARKQALDQPALEQPATEQPATEQESAPAEVSQSIHNSPAEEAVQEERSTTIQEPVVNVKLEEPQDAPAPAPAPVEDQKPKLESLESFNFTQQPASAESQPASENPQDATQPQPQAGQEAIISIDPLSSMESPEAQHKPQAVVPKQEDVEAPPPAAAEANDDINYESLFGPEGAHDNHPDLNFDDFDFGPDNTASAEQVQTQDFAHSAAHMDLSTFGDHTQQQQQQQQQFSNDDVSSMLQGLETYANQAPDEGGDVDMLGVGDGNNDAAAGGEAEAGGDRAIDGGAGAGHDEFGMSGADLDLAMGMGANETTFDDLLDGMDFGGGGGEGEGGLEGQEFDDAFFGIGES